MLQVLILNFILIVVLSDQIYPSIEELQLQLENDGWIDCSDKTPILATTCSGDDLEWLECYLVPKNGLCSKQNISVNSSEKMTFLFTFYKPNFDTYTIEINSDIKTGQVQIQDNIGRATIESSQQNISLKINQEGAYFTGLSISKECNPNCKSCENGFCTQCNDNYYLYNYKCQSDDCDLSIITNNFITSSVGSVEDGQYIITLKYDFKIAFCLIPKIYFTKGIKDSSIQKILDKNQIKYNLNSQTPESLQITLPLDQIYSMCEQITTSSAYVYQCYLGVALTSSQITQFLAIIIGQISVERSTQSVYQYTQSVAIPGSSDVEIGPVFIVSETLSQDLYADENKMKVVQTISDPQLSNFQLSYNEAYVIQNGQRYNLSLNYEISKGVTTTFEFDWEDGLFDAYSQFQFYINSLAKPATNRIRRRQLDVPIKREQLSVVYQVQDQKDFNLDLQSSSLNDVNDAIVYPVIVLSFLCIIGLAFVISKVKKNNENNVDLQK